MTTECPRCGVTYDESASELLHNGIHGSQRVETTAHGDERESYIEICSETWCKTTLAHYHDAEGYVRFERPK